MLDAVRARLAGRSYWVARYLGRDDVHEWDVDWVNVPRRGMIELRLHCPNGQVGVLGNTADISDRAFQFKTGQVRVPGGKSQISQTIGVLTGTNGQAVTYTWDMVQQVLEGPVDGHVGVDQLMTTNFDLLGARV